MSLHIESLDRPSLPDVPRLIEDLGSTIALYQDSARRERPIHPSTATLQVLGEAFHAAALLGTATALRRHGGFDKVADSWLLPAMAGTVRLSYVLHAAILGRPSLRALFCIDGRYDMDACLRWLVLHGVRELRLLPFLSSGFVTEVRTPSLLVDGQRISPLQSCIMAERSDTLLAFRSSPGTFQSFFGRWFLDHAVGDYAHAWLMTDAQMRQSLREQPSGERLGVPAVVQPPPGLQFLDANPDPKSGPVSPKPAARPDYRSFGSDYPCAYLDLADSGAVDRAVLAGQVRSSPQAGIELLSPHTALRLPSAAAGMVLARIELRVPDDDALWVRLRGWDHPWSMPFERIVPAAALNAGAVTIPFTDHGMTPRLDIAFARPGQDPAARPDYQPTYGLLRSLQLWRAVG